MEKWLALLGILLEKEEFLLGLAGVVLFLLIMDLAGLIGVALALM